MTLEIQIISYDNAPVQYRDVPAKRMTVLVSASQNTLFLLGSVRDSLTKSCSFLPLFLDSKQTVYFFIISSVRRLCSLLSYKLIYVNNVHTLRVQTGQPNSLKYFVFLDSVGRPAVLLAVESRNTIISGVTFAGS